MNDNVMSSITHGHLYTDLLNESIHLIYLSNISFAHI